jgi:hypothetical protein
VDLKRRQRVFAWVRPELIDVLRPGDGLPTVPLGLGGLAQIDNLTGTDAPT